MNKALAATIRFLNAALALLIIIGCAAAGTTISSYLQTLGVNVSVGSATLIGLFFGFIIATALCGILAIFIEIRSELILIRKFLEENLIQKRIEN